MIIRHFAENDLGQILDLCREVRQVHIDILDGYFLPQDDEFEKIGFLESLTDSSTIALVAEDNGRICGYLLGGIREVPYLKKPCVAKVYNFGVAENMRRQGLGRRLMDTFFDICRTKKADQVILGVYHKNRSAVDFYEQYGFEPLKQTMIFKLQD